jgi:tRNA 5-methylaminomethyl-2-thiouridine biosynthesis bifunctional protein
MTQKTIWIEMTTTPRSKVFDDVYFSQADGLAETLHVFLQGNQLPERWSEQAHFTIAETGFGTGLNFLATARLFRETARPGQRLEFISFEQFPLSATEIAQYLDVWRGDIGIELDQLCAGYPDPHPGQHYLVLDDAIALTLYIDDVNLALPRLDTTVDAWFLDGFKPASNPAMWSDVVFQNMPRLSRPGTTFATFTAAGFVKRGLQAAGFRVSKVRGFGHKRDMLTGVFTGVFE